MSKLHQPSAPNTPSRRQVLKGSAIATGAATFAALGTNFAYAQASDEIRIGLVGCGGRGRGAVSNAIESSKGVKLVAIADLFPEKIDETKKMWADKPKDQYDFGKHAFSGFNSYKELLAQANVNYAILATPPGFRPMMIDEAIKQGKHIFAEKPVAVDAPGCRQIMEAAKVAKEKGLGIVAGTQRRHENVYNETIKRIQGGAIGKVVGGQVYWVGGELWMKPRQATWTDMEWQLRNWMYFTWLSGDLIVEQHVHNIDVANWVIGRTPRSAIALGGRQTRTDPAYGMIYDHFAVHYDYSPTPNPDTPADRPDGPHVMSMSRQIDQCYTRNNETFQGLAGSALVSGGVIRDLDGKITWKFPAKQANNPYETEHANLIESIRKGQPLNEGQTIAESVLTAIMGRMSAYTGQIVTWQQALKSQETLVPANLAGLSQEEFFKSAPPAPIVPLPGKTKLS